MATTIKLKNSVTTTNAPSSLVQGEVAINITDKKVWVGNAATTPIQLLGDGASASFGALSCTTLSASGVATFSAGTVSAPAITTTGDTNTGIFFPAADTIAFTEGGVESMRIDSSGNVGIGTSSPRVVSGYKNLTLDGSTSGLFEINTNGTRVFSVYGASNDINLVNPTATGTMQFYTNNTERMRIDSSGNVGIGTSSPTTKLTVNGALSSIGASSIYGIYRRDTSAYVGGWYSAAGTISLDTAVGAAINIDSSGNVGIGNTVASTIDSQNSAGNLVVGNGSGAEGITIYTATTQSGTVAFADGTSAGDTYRGYIQYEQSNNALTFGTNATERMRIDNSGNLLVGTTTGSFHVIQNTVASNYACGVYNQSGTTPYALILSLPSVTGGAGGGFLTCADNANRLLIAGNGNVTNVNGGYGTISDKKLKENIVDATPKLEKVNHLKVRNYNLIGDELKQIGFVAQEFEQIFPSMVEETVDRDKEGNDLGTTTKSIKTSVLIPILVKAIQEQQVMIEELKAEVALLKSK